MLSAFALDVVQMRVDFVHYPLIYYFHPGPQHASLPEALLLLTGFSQRGLNNGNPEPVRLAAAGLYAALRDLAKLLADNFVRADADDPAAAFRAYASDHLAPLPESLASAQQRQPQSAPQSR